MKRKMEVRGMYFMKYNQGVGDGSHSWIAAGEEPDAHQFMSRFVYKRGARMEVNSKQYCSNSETRPGMHGKMRS